MGGYVIAVAQNVLYIWFRGNVLFWSLAKAPTPYHMAAYSDYIAIASNPFFVQEHVAGAHFINIMLPALLHDLNGRRWSSVL